MGKTVNTGYIIFLAAVSAIGGILFGYDTAVISGTIGIVTQQFSLDTIQQGWYVGCALIGSIAGATFAGMLSDAAGRKKTMLTAAVLFCICAIGCAESRGFVQLVISRIIGGIGVGIVSIVSPIYISEVSTAEKRGTLVSLYQLAVTVGFLTGHGERDTRMEADRDYYAFATAKFFRHSLINNGFDVVDISLEGDARIPEETGILVIADPRTDCSDAEIAKISAYIADGGNLLLAAEPGHTGTADRIASLFGASFEGDRLSVPRSDYRQDLMLAEVTEAAVEEMPSLKGLRRHDYKITMPGATGISVTPDSGFEVKTILESVPDSWNERQTTDFENSAAAPDSVSGEQVHARSLAVCLQRESGDSGKKQRILLFGDADCFSNAELMRDRYAVASGNFSLLFEAFRWLTDGEYPVDTPRPRGSDNGFDMQIGSLPAVRWIFTAVIPLIMLVISVVIIARRKSR